MKNFYSFVCAEGFGKLTFFLGQARIKAVYLFCPSFVPNPPDEWKS
jgi:hypothetical protein